MRNLYILPSAEAFMDADGCWIDRKMYDGLRYISSRWGGNVIVYFRRTEDPILFDKANVGKSMFASLIYENELNLSAVDPDALILASADDYRQLYLPYKYPDLKKNIIYVIENTFDTRLKIILSEQRNLARLIGGFGFLVRREYALRRALKICGGLQANGYPAFEKYGKYCKNSILYFDTRLDENNINFSNEKPCPDRSKALRLAYSGRLTKIKGSDFLIPLARELRDLGTNYVLTIYGDGELFGSMKKTIESEGLESKILLKGAVDYEKILVPGIRDETDLFVMPHIQGDPSCTYFETLTLGVPIIGFDNEAWMGILRHFGEIGWSVRSGDIRSMARLIDEFEKNRNILVEKSDFVKKMTRKINFQSQFDIRLNQLSSTQTDVIDTCPQQLTA